MKKRAISHFFMGTVLAFSIEILVMTFAVLLEGGESMPVIMNVEAFALAVCCSVIGTVFNSNRLSFLVQAVLTYVFSLATVLLFAFMFHWESMGHGFFAGKSLIILVIVLFTVGYSVTMTVTFFTQKRKQKRMNEKLAEYQKKSNDSGKQ